MTSVWACPGGITAAGLAGRPGRRFRDSFLGTVAAGALSLAFGGPAQALLPAGCTLSGGGTIETCTGDQHAGVAIAAPTTLTTLNVNNLTTAITPVSTTPGISFSSAGAIAITSNTGTFGITTSNANGIYANGSLAVTVTSTGNITTSGTGANAILVQASLAATVISTGNIITAGVNANGIVAQAFNVAGSPATVTSTGNITTMGVGARGISAYSTAGAVNVTSTGNIATAGSNSTAIFADSNGAGAVTVTSTGNITTAGTKSYGISTYSSTGATTVTSTGNIATAGTKAYGIVAINNGTGAITVTSTGNITNGQQRDRD
jgi:hypothetical protein